MMKANQTRYFKKVGKWIAGIIAAVASTVIATLIVKSLSMDDNRAANPDPSPPVMTHGGESSSSLWQSKGGSWNFSEKQIFGQGASDFNKAYFAGNNYSDFIYEVRLRKISNNDGPLGLLLRYDEQHDEGYLLLLWPHGDYQFSRLVNQTRHAMGSGTPKVLNKGNLWNTVKVIGRGNSLKLYINGEHQVDFDGSVYSFGRLGLVIHGTPDQKAEFFILSKNAF